MIKNIIRNIFKIVNIPIFFRINRKKISFKNFMRFVWCFAIILILFYIVALLISERKYEWLNIYQYILANEKYILANGKKSNINKPNILSIEFSKLEATHGEIEIKGCISVSFYNPDEYFNKKSTIENNDKVEVKIRCPKEKGYSQIVEDIKCSREDDEYGTFSSGAKETVFIPKGGHLFDYPFDKLIFLIPISFKPKIEFDQIDIYHRVHRMLLKDHPTITFDDSGILLNLELVRKNSIQIAFGIIFFSIFLYIILILIFVKKLGSLVLAVGGFFISIWSIRSLFSEEALVYPNLLDLTVIFASLILLLGILTKIFFGKCIKDDDI